MGGRVKLEGWPRRPGLDRTMKNQCGGTWSLSRITINLVWSIEWTGAEIRGAKGGSWTKADNFKSLQQWMCKIQMNWLVGVRKKPESELYWRWVIAYYMSSQTTWNIVLWLLSIKLLHGVVVEWLMDQPSSKPATNRPPPTPNLSV